jgi:hypothetical protein
VAAAAAAAAADVPAVAAAAVNIGSFPPLPPPLDTVVEVIPS